MAETKDLLKKIDTYRDFVIDIQTKMTACPAVSPEEGGLGEAAKAEVLLATLKEMKFDEIKVINIKDPKSPTGVRPNIIAKYYGQNRKKTFWVMAHMDVVPPGDLSLWKTDPYKAVVKGDKIYGRGTEDNQQGIVSGLLVAKAMMDLGIRPSVNYALLLNCDEEMGSNYGIEPILKKHAKIFGKDDSFMVPDGGCATGEMVEIAEKSQLWLKFTTIGKQTHSSTPANGNNAFIAGSHLVVALDELHKKFPKKDKLFDVQESIFCPTKKEANVPNINSIPGTDIFYLDCRVLPCYTLEKVLAEIKKITQKIEKKFKVKIKIEEVLRGVSKPTDKKAPIVSLVAQSVKAVYRNNPKIQGVGGGTVAASLRNEGFPAVVYSKLDETMHQPNEFSSIKNTMGDAKVFALVAMGLK
ncbi:MAG: M20 family metallo-hydrolase [Elusimicrobiaceae bacterium]|nr:M20 family metallo-hydrolase [Elusimicrobiaceae bacterium]